MLLRSILFRLSLAAAVAGIITGCDQTGAAPSSQPKAGEPPKSGDGAASQPSGANKPPDPGPPKPGISRGPYLQMATQESIRIVWRQREVARPVVKWGETQDALTHELSLDKGIIVRTTAALGGTSTGEKPLHSAASETRQFEAQVTGLEPDKRYFYAVFNGATRLTPDDGAFFFRTLPVVGADRGLWAWVAGDGGTGGRIQAAVHGAMQDFTRQHNVALDAFIHVGDMAYQSGLDSEFQGRFFEMYGATLRNTVCWPAMGNHEGKTSKGFDGVGPYYDAYITPTKGEAGGVASGREAYYSYDFGRIHFIVLDSCNEGYSKKGVFTPLGDGMMAWLKDDLDHTKADWLVAYWHHPPYTKGSHNSDIPADYESRVMRERFVPLLESAGVDLILTGHSHIYERSMLMDGAYSTPTTAENAIIDDGDGDPAGDGAYKKSAGLNPHEGVVNVVTGNAGTSLKRVGTMPVMKRIILEHGSVLLNIKGDTLSGLMLNKDGQRRDVFQIVKSGKLPPRAKLDHPKPAPPMPEVKTVRADGATGEDAKKTADTVEEIKDFEPIIAKEADWKYTMGAPPISWEQVSFDDSKWQEGEAGFGYGDGDDNTTVEMSGHSRTLCVRSEFTLTGKEDLKRLYLLVDYDDAFIAYINGHEVARSKNVSGSGTTARVLQPHEAGKFEGFPLGQAATNLRKGKNIIAIIGYNDDLKSSDFSLHPALVLKN